jgi:cytosine/creatinine deaminase
VHLQALAIPEPLRGFDSDAVVFDVTLGGGCVASIQPTRDAACATLVSAFVDAHVHLDKTHTVNEVGATQGDLFAAIERMAVHRAGWTASDLHTRMSRALHQAWRSGTRAVRTHLDWVQRETPVSLAVLQALRQEWAGRIDLQAVSLTPLDLFEDIATGAHIAAQVARAQGVLGAFVYRNTDLVNKLQRVFDLAQQHQLALDFHVDEGLDADATGLHTIAQLTIENAYQGRVSCGHACSLSMQNESNVALTLDLSAQAAIHLIALPTTNLYLQGAWNRTPVQRGITCLLEAQARGVNTCMATDNVADGFYPYGSYDLMESYSLGVQMAHLAPADRWLSTITTSPARALNLAWDGLIQVGCPADLVLLAARTPYELLTPAGRERTVFRNGQAL